MFRLSSMEKQRTKRHTIAVVVRYVKQAQTISGQWEVNTLLTSLTILPFPQVEVFNILFIREHEKRHVVHCVDCAKKQSYNLDGFVCLEEYRMKDLIEVYNGFVLHKVSWDNHAYQTSVTNEFHSTEQIPTATIQSNSTSNNIAGVISSVAGHYPPIAGPASTASTPSPTSQQPTNNITASQV